MIRGCFLSILLFNSAISANLYPYGLDSDKQLIANDDAYSRSIALNPPLHFYRSSYRECLVHSMCIKCMGYDVATSIQFTKASGLADWARSDLTCLRAMFVYFISHRFTIMVLLL